MGQTHCVVPIYSWGWGHGRIGHPGSASVYSGLSKNRNVRKLSQGIQGHADIRLYRYVTSGYAFRKSKPVRSKQNSNNRLTLALSL